MEFFDMLASIDPAAWDKIAAGTPIIGGPGAAPAQGMPAGPVPQPVATPAPPAGPAGVGTPAMPNAAAPAPGPAIPGGDPTPQAGPAGGADTRTNPFAMSPEMIRALSLAMQGGGQYAPRPAMPSAAPVRPGQLSIARPIGNMPQVGLPAAARRGF